MIDLKHIFLTMFRFSLTRSYANVDLWNRECLVNSLNLRQMEMIALVLICSFILTNIYSRIVIKPLYNRRTLLYIEIHLHYLESQI